MAVRLSWSILDSDFGGLEGGDLVGLGLVGERVAGEVHVQIGGEFLGAGRVGLGRVDQGLQSLIWFLSIIKSCSSVCLPRGVASSILLSCRSIVDSLVILDRTEMSLISFLGADSVHNLFKAGQGGDVLDLVVSEVQRVQAGQVLEGVDLFDLVAGELDVLQGS